MLGSKQIDCSPFFMYVSLYSNIRWESKTDSNFTSTIVKSAALSRSHWRHTNLITEHKIFASHLSNIWSTNKALPSNHMKKWLKVSFFLNVFFLVASFKRPAQIGVVEKYHGHAPRSKARAKRETKWLLSSFYKRVRCTWKLNNFFS